MPEPKKIHVLLLEDNPQESRQLQQIFSQKDSSDPQFRIFNAGRLQEGIDCLRRQPIDVILLDLKLPAEGGIQALLTLYEEAPDVPVVVLTEMAEAPRAADFTGRGVQDYLVKGQLNHFTLVSTLLYAIERGKIQREHVIIASELKEANEKLEKLVYSDPLTGLLNRRGLQNALSREVLRAVRERQELLALILDLDNFKRINDLLGYGVGDIVLNEIAKTLTASVRITDYVTRIGGDEFLVLMPDTRFAEGARLAEKVRRALTDAAIPLSMGSSYQVTASLGLLQVSPDMLSIDELLAQTHYVLQRSKKMGKNRVSYGFGEEDGYESNISNILGSLKNGREYQVLKQPIFRLSDKALVGYEFLSRFSMSGLEMPDDFFRVALENNILTTVDSQCLKNCVTFGTSLSNDCTQHVNVFPTTLIDLPSAQLVRLFKDANPHGKFCVEISEQQIIGDPSYLIEPVLALRQAGITVAIDDVGFGRSSLESLVLLEPDVVKIDKKWVNGISGNIGFERCLKRLQKITGAIGSELIAEGIEKEEDLKTLVKLGVLYGQGYFLGRPA